jgi:hypothetical protein
MIGIASCGTHACGVTHRSCPVVLEARLRHDKFASVPPATL